jgi:hypothetical protein
MRVSERVFAFQARSHNDRDLIRRQFILQEQSRSGLHDDPAAGIDPGQRRLNGLQTTGRNYRNLSRPTFEMANDDDVVVPMRDGVTLLADVHRPSTPGKYPVLIAASPYPRQIQNLGTPPPFPHLVLSRGSSSGHSTAQSSTHSVKYEAKADRREVSLS